MRITPPDTDAVATSALRHAGPNAAPFSSTSPIAFIGLHGVQHFVVDYGVLWSARRQAQNSADAAAHGRGDIARLRRHQRPGAGAQSCARRRREKPGVGPGARRHGGRHHLPRLPAGFARRRTNPACESTCFATSAPAATRCRRSSASSSASTSRASAPPPRPKSLFGDSTDCVKPFAIPDKWHGARNTARRLGSDRHL